VLEARQVLKIGSSKVLKFGGRLYRAALPLLNRQDAKVAKIIRQFTRMDEWARMDGVFLTAKNAKNAKGGREWVQMHANME
jgi:hypothetical protein